MGRLKAIALFKRISARIAFSSAMGLSMLLMFPAQNVTAAPTCENVFAKSTEEQMILDFRQGSKDFFVARDLAKKILAQPESMQQESLQSIGRIYRAVPKKDPNPTAAWHIGGRRLLDYTMALVQRQDLKFAKGHAEGKSGKELYQEFLNEQAAIFGTQYSAHEVLTFAQHVQQQLPLLQAQHPGPGLKIILGGSFINGKAQIKTSDLDVSVNQPKLMQMKPQWEEVFNFVMREKNPETNMTIEMHGEPAAFYGKINPVVLVISAEKIIVQVFEPAQIANRPSELEARKFAEYPL